MRQLNDGLINNFSNFSIMLRLDFCLKRVANPSKNQANYFFLTFELDHKICWFSREIKILGKIINYFDFFCSFTKFFFYFDNYFENISLNISIP